MNFVKVGENFVVLGEVKHSQIMSEKSLRAWLIFLPDASISSAHCTCMAGLGECCSHTAAIAFALYFRSSSEELSCTDKLSTWIVPKTKQQVFAKEINKIDWGKRNTSYDDIYEQQVSPLSGAPLENFLRELELADSNASILSVCEPFALERKKPIRVKNLPPVLTDLYNESYKNLPLHDLQSIDVDFKITEEQLMEVAFETIKQSEKISWFQYRAGRITASKFKSICNTSLEKPSLSLLKSICYPVKINQKVAAIQWGINHEKIALDKYTRNMNIIHKNLTVILVGFTISMEMPIVGASPDAIVNCDCCGSGCVEIKCPYRLKDSSVDFDTLLTAKNSFLIKNEDGEFMLNPEHDYYYQTQLQMFCLETEYCDFVVWSKQKTMVLRTYVDTDFLSENLVKAELFHKKVIVPELLARYFSSPKEKILEIVLKNNENASE